MTELPVDQVRTLLAVVDHGTFDAAAAALHLTPSAVSQRVKALELRVGRVLVLRTKPARLTESGEVVVRFARQLSRLESDARAELGLSDEGASLPIAVNADSLATWFLSALARVPDVYFELHREDEDHTTRLLREGLVMAAVTSSPDAVQGCTVRKLGQMRYQSLATPAFAERWLSGGSLADAPVVVFDRRDVLQDRFVRRVTRRQGASARRHYVPASEAYVEAIGAGLGWGLVPDTWAESLLRAGTLVDLAPGRWANVPLYWQQWKLDSPALTAVADAVAAAAREQLS